MREQNSNYTGVDKENIKPKIGNQSPSVKRSGGSVDIAWESLYLHIFQSDLAFFEFWLGPEVKAWHPELGQ